MMIDVVVRGVGEVKLLCSLYEVVVTFEVVVSYVNHHFCTAHGITTTFIRHDLTFIAKKVNGRTTKCAVVK